MKVLFFDPEQYVGWEDEPSNYQVRLPFLNSGVVTEHRDFVYQQTLNAEGRDAMNREALNAFREFRPDLVVNSLAWWPECLDWTTLRGIRAEGGKVISVFWDTWLDSLPHEVELALNSDLILIMDSLTNYFKFRLVAEQHGRPNSVAFSPIAVFTDLVRPRPREKTRDVLLLGSNEGQRVALAQHLTETLAADGVTLHRLGGLTDDESSEADWISWDQYVDAINETKIALNSQTQPDRFQIKGKIFDFLACGTFCLTDDNPELRRIVPDGCLAYYEDPADCADKIKYYLRESDERQAIAERGRDWFNDVYDYKKFWNALSSAILTGEAPPELPGIAPAYEQYKSNQALIYRNQLYALDYLGRAVNGADSVRRLPVRAEGAYHGVNILTVDDRWTVTANSLLIDFLEIDGKLHALAPGTGLIPLSVEELYQSPSQQLCLANSIEHAKQVIDLIELKTNR